MISIRLTLFLSGFCFALLPLTSAMAQPKKIESRTPNKTSPPKKLSFTEIFRNGLVALNKRDYEDAILLFNDGLSISPRDATAWFYLSYAELKAGNIEKSEVAFLNAKQHGYDFSDYEKNFSLSGTIDSRIKTIPSMTKYLIAKYPAFQTRISSSKIESTYGNSMPTTLPGTVWNTALQTGHSHLYGIGGLLPIANDEAESKILQNFDVVGNLPTGKNTKPNDYFLLRYITKGSFQFSDRLAEWETKTIEYCKHSQSIPGTFSPIANSAEGIEIYRCTQYSSQKNKGQDEIIRIASSREMLYVNQIGYFIPYHGQNTWRHTIHR